MMSISETKKKQNTTLALIGQSGPYKYNTLFITQGYNNCVDFINSLYSALHIRSKNLIPILLRPDISKMYIEYDMMYEYIIKQIPATTNKQPLTTLPTISPCLSICSLFISSSPRRTKCFVSF